MSNGTKDNGKYKFTRDRMKEGRKKGRKERLKCNKVRSKKG
jgi:hypothetical protein